MSNIKKVVMTRTTDVFVGLNRRSQIAVENNADVLISVHLNAFDGTANGVETFAHTNSTASEPLTRNINSRMRDELSKLAGRRITDRGAKKANFAVLRGTYRTMLSALTESLFMDNRRDSDVIKHRDFARVTAKAIADGVRETVKDRKDVVVCVDAGHGGHDNGATGFGLREKDVALKISLALRDELEGRTSTENLGSSSSSPSFTNMSAANKYREIEKAVKDQGLSVRQLQNLLIAAGEQMPRFGADGKPGAETLNAIQVFQERHGLSSPSGNFFGRPGPSTIEKLRDIVKYREQRRRTTPMVRGEDIRQAQRVLNITADGIFGDQTRSAVQKYQLDNDLSSPAGNFYGVLGPATWKHLFG